MTKIKKIIPFCTHFVYNMQGMVSFLTISNVAVRYLSLKLQIET